jgi:YHS domain-containing protein
VDGEWALVHLQRALWDPVDPSRLGSIEADLLWHVNGEAYRFADKRNLRRFMEHPTNWCGILRDPVSGCRFRPSNHSPEAYWVNGPYFFESDSTKRVFLEDPARYQVIRPI